MPALALSLRMGVLPTVQVWPASVEWNTRAPEEPPVPNHASRVPRTIRHELLAAKTPSFGTAEGVFWRCHVTPPSDAVSTAKWPSTGSPTTIPCEASQNASASKNPLGSGLV